MSEIIIGLDAGHGGTSSGTYSCNTTKDGLYEKDYALEVVKMVDKRLVEHGFKTVLTRTTDINPGNVSKRAQICVDGKCNYAVSIHFNGFSNQNAKGCEVFVPCAETSAGIEVGYYNYLGKFFSKRAPFARSNNYYNRNTTFDKKMSTETRKFGAQSNDKDYFGFVRTSWEKGLSADLLEICFLTNPEDFKTFTENKQAVSDAIARSIVEGFGKEWKGETTEETKEDTKEETKTETVSKTIYRVQVGAFSDKNNAKALQDKLKKAGFDSYIKEESK